ncbi:serine/threonine-protein kinase [Limnoglobus roseus]|uniref:non-specific serine/threonine protein kinase n=1 Tax=Limnoglobus roseus TaxID=2598579 RepID=A0A5C1AAA9_9BACT|nr:serine/threonine-protein kinase [Limnoglobus roseus]QEL15505.1 serine/threonine protein kinase [Limnoglobus roseus]
MGSNLHALTDSRPAEAVTLRMNNAHPLADGLPTDIPTPPPTARLSGGYELNRVLGRGGMGIVYLARHSGLKRNVAYKVLTHLGCTDPETRARFHAEAETLGKLQHSGIVQIFDYGTENGSPFLVMEYVCGGSLAESFKNGRLPPRDAASLVATMAAAVGHAHAQGVIHRDLKPANILLTADGRPKVADFGLARDVTREHLTRTGMIAGTPTYMPPEQLLGRKDLTPAVDVWAIGVLLYEMLSGTVPFGGDNPQQILTNILQHEPVSLRAWQPGLPRDLETICRKCMHKDPHRRYPNGESLAADLTRFLDGKPILARPIGRVEKGLQWCRQNRTAAALTVGLVLTMTAATGVSLLLADRANWDRGNAVTAAAQAEDSRQKAEAATADEKAAREGAETLASMMDALFDKMRVPEVDLRREVKVQIDLGAKRLLAGACEPLVRAKLLYRLTEVRLRWGDWPEAVPLAEQAFALRSRHLGPHHPDTHAAAHQLAYLYSHVSDRKADAVRVLKPVVEAEVAALPPDDPQVVGLLGSLALAYKSAGQTAEYDRLAARVLTLAEKQYGPDHVETEWRRVNLSKYSVAAHNYDEAIPVLTKAYKTLGEKWGEGSDPFLWLRRHIGAVLCAAGRSQEAIDYLRPAYEHGLRIVGPTHPHVVGDRSRLAAAYEACRMYAEDLPLRRAMLDNAIARKSLPDTGEQLLKIARDTAWAWRTALN